MHNSKFTLFRRFSRPVRSSVSALLLALACLFINPLSAAACGGLFPADSSTEQRAQRLIFAVDPGQITLYEQIHYTGSPKDFAWVLPVPAVPQVDTASIRLFQELDQQTAPRFSLADAPSCPGSHTAGAPAPLNGGTVNVYRSGGVGPYSYNVIGSSDPQALTRWLKGTSIRFRQSRGRRCSPALPRICSFWPCACRVTRVPRICSR